MTVRSTTTVLVLVKAAPQPSSTYGETVCVAGLEGPVERPRWLRLYPVPFRYLDGERQFRKYDLVEVTTRDTGADKRPESRKITADSIKINVNLKSGPRELHGSNERPVRRCVPFRRAFART